MRRVKKQYNPHPLYKSRTMTEKMNVSFDFVRENWRQWLKFSLYFLLPLSIVQGAAVDSFWDMQNDIKAFSWSVIVLNVSVFFIGLAVDTALMIMFIKWCQTHSDGLSQCSMSYLRSVMPKATLRCLMAWLVIFVITLPALLVSVLGSIVIPFFVIIVFFLLLPLLMMCPIYLLEDNATFVSSLKRSFSLGLKRWGAIILVAVVAILTIVFLENVVNIPYVVANFVKAQIFSNTDTESLVWKVLLEMLVYVVNVLHCFVTYLGIAMFTLVMTYHYGSLAVEVENVDLESEIDNFANQ